jgi:hypothetical protein
MPATFADQPRTGSGAAAIATATTASSHRARACAGGSSASAATPPRRPPTRSARQVVTCRPGPAPRPAHHRAAPLPGRRPASARPRLRRRSRLRPRPRPDARLRPDGARTRPGLRLRSERRHLRRSRALGPGAGLHVRGSSSRSPAQTAPGQDSRPNALSSRTGPPTFHRARLHRRPPGRCGIAAGARGTWPSWGAGRPRRRAAAVRRRQNAAGLQKCARCRCSFADQPRCSG